MLLLAALLLAILRLLRLLRPVLGGVEAQPSDCDYLNSEYAQLGHILDAFQQKQDKESLDRVIADYVLVLENMGDASVLCLEEVYK